MDESIDLELQESIFEQWRHLLSDASEFPSQRFHLVLTGAVRIEQPGLTTLQAHDSGDAPDLLATRLTFTGLENMAGSAFLFHAAGVAASDGRVIALIGPSGRGKTTAARALGQSMAYVSDETIAFRDDLSVIPYPKPLSIGQRPGVKTMASPLTLGMRVATEPLRLAALVLLDRREKPTAPRVEDVPLRDALGDLVEQSSSLGLLPQPLRSLANVIATTGGVKRIVYSDADHLQQLVDSILASAPVAHPSVAEVKVEPIAPTVVGNLGRAPFIDALFIDEQLVILTDGKLHILAGIGPELWLQASDKDIRQLTARLRETLGDPPAGVDLSVAAAEAVNALLEENLLVRKDA